jgi:hypothetical protein
VYQDGGNDSVFESLGNPVARKRKNSFRGNYSCHREGCVIDDSCYSVGHVTKVKNFLSLMGSTVCNNM